MKKIFFILNLIYYNICNANINDTIPYFPCFTPTKKSELKTHYNNLPDKSILNCYNCKDLGLIGLNRNIKNAYIYDKKCRLDKLLFLQQDLRELHLHISKLILPDSAKGLYKLESFSMTDYKQKEVPNFIWDNKNIKTLSLYLDDFKAVEGKLSKLQNLVWLDLEMDKITYLPNDIFQLSGLETLRIRLEKKGEMLFFPTELKLLQKLQNLALPISFELLEEHLDELQSLTQFEVQTASNVDKVIEVLKKYPNIKSINIGSWKQEEFIKVHRVLPYIQRSFM